MSDIAEIFAKDPLGLTQEDLTLIVKVFREARNSFNLGVKAAPKEKKTKAAPGEAINLGELDL